MELRVLRYFLAVVREGSITAAAQSLHMTQPTLSKQLMELEDELGKQLFVRGKHRVRLTEAGEFMYRRAQEIVDLADRTRTALRSQDGTIAGDISIGCGETEGMRVLIHAMKALIADHPHVRFHLYSGNDEDVSARLEKGLVDFGLFVGNTDLSGYDFLRLPVADTWGLVLQQTHPLAQKTYITPDDMRGLALLCSRQTLERNELSGWLGDDFQSLNVVSTHNLIGNAVLMVQEGVGCAVTISGLINTRGTGIVFRPFAPEIRAELVVAWKKHPAFSAPARAFLQYLQSTIAQEAPDK